MVLFKQNGVNKLDSKKLNPPCEMTLEEKDHFFLLNKWWFLALGNNLSLCYIQLETKYTMPDEQEEFRQKEQVRILEEGLKQEEFKKIHWRSERRLDSKLFENRQYC